MSDIGQDIRELSLAQRTELELRLLQNRPATASRVIPRQDATAPAPLSFAQQRLWFLDQLHPGRSTYNIARRIRMDGQLDVPALHQALQGVVARHETLRTTLVAVDGRPQQLVSPTLSIPLPLTDLSMLPDREAQVQRLAVEEVRRPFDLARGPLFRAVLFRLAPLEHLLVLTVHHAVSDAWSLGVMSREIGTLYGAFIRGEPSPLPELPIQYGDFATWQRGTLAGAALERELTYWRQQLQSPPPALDLPTDRPRPPVESTRGAKQSIVIPKAVSDGLKALSQREGATLFTTLLAAFHTLLSRYTGQHDIVIGSPIAGRTLAETEGLIGFFVNTLALRLDSTGDPTFRQLLRDTREVALGAYAHQDLPFEKLVEELQPERDLRRTPLFQVAFAYQNFPSHKLELPGLALRSEPAESGNAKFDLMLYMWQRTDGLRAVLEYNTDLFETGTIIRMLGHLETLLQSIARDADQRISELPILSDPEMRQVVVEWNATAGDTSPGSVHGLVEEQAARTPSAVAVVGRERQLTYAELEWEANQLAHRLRSYGVGPDVRVGVSLGRSPDLIVALLAVLKAGGAYVPLDPGYPPERLRFLVHDARVAVLLTDDSSEGGSPDVGGVPVLKVSGALASSAAAEQDGPLQNDLDPSHLAYVIYTSGSTGIPKGVAITHSNAVAFLTWARRATSPEAGARVLASTSISFDLSVYEIFGTLSWGGTVLLLSSALELPDRPELQVPGGATLLNTVPSAAASLVRLGAIPQGLLRINLAGEAVSRALVDSLYATGPEEVYNLYGPSETTTYSTSAPLGPGGSGLPAIGRPIANTRAYVLDGNLKPLPIGVPGELYLGGAGVARGYLGRPALTAERFLPDPFGTLGGSEPGRRLYRTGDRARWRADGNLEFLGRLDQQLKLRGFRIEPGEIESALVQHPEVRTAVVIAREDSPDDVRLVAYVVPEKAPPSSDELRGVLQQRLPGYMVPDAIVFLAALPLTANGKLDRSALPAPNAVPRDDYAAPESPVEELLAGIWAGVLRLSRVGVRDNFFAIGGHSLLATQVVSRIRTVMGVDLPLRVLFENPTVSTLAARISNELLVASAATAPELVRLPREAYRVNETSHG